MIFLSADLIIQQGGQHSKEGQGGGARDAVPCAGQGRDHVHARLRLPPGVHYRAPALANHLST